MRGWSSWLAGWLALSAGFGCELMPRSNAGSAPDGGLVMSADAGTSGEMLPPTRQLATVPTPAVQLAADDRAIYGLTAAGGIWRVRSDATAPESVIAGGGLTGRGGDAGALIVAGGDLFWVDCQTTTGTLHRLPTNGGRDDALRSGVECEPGALAGDDEYVYWAEPADAADESAGDLIRALPRTAAAGDPPSLLASTGRDWVVRSMVSYAGSLYWTTYEPVATGFYAGLFTAPVATLLAGGSATQRDDLGDSYGLAASCGGVVFGRFKDLSTSVVASLFKPTGAPTVLSILPLHDTLEGVADMDGQELVLTGDGGRVYAILSTGGGPVLIARGAKTPAVSGPAGATFIDANDMLVAITSTDIDAAVFGR
jgi:hypothetical protein